MNDFTEANDHKKEWVEPAIEVLSADKTASGFGGFDEDSDTKSGS